MTRPLSVRFVTAAAVVRAVSATWQLTFCALAMFLPYYNELLLGLAMPGAVGYVVGLWCVQRRQYPWFLWSATAASAVTVAVTVAYLVCRILPLYYAVVALNLCTVGYTSVVAVERSHRTRRGRKVPYAIVCSVLVAIVFLLGVEGAYSNLYYHRTVMASMSALILRVVHRDDADVPAYFDTLLVQEEAPYSFPTDLFSQSVREDTLEGMPVYFVNEGHGDAVILYLHGGYYVNQASRMQLIAMRRLLDATDVAMVMPVYPLAPYHSCADSFDAMVRLYARLAEAYPDKRMILLGDSAGGGYALAVAQTLAAEGHRCPDRLILLSPWVDVTMTNGQIDYYRYEDPLLTKTMSIRSGLYWAGEWDARDPRVSPLYGSMAGLGDVSVFVGTNEMFYPDVMRMYDAMREADVRVNMYVGDSLNHVYPFYPTLEGRLAMEQIAAIVRAE